MRKKYLTISEFGDLCNVDRKTLIYYHKEGVFAPEYVGENGYRYYNINQFETFNILKDFRDLGVSIKEIKAYLEERNPEEYLKILCKEQKKVTERLERLEEIRDKIAAKIEITKKGISETEGEVYIDYFEEEQLFVKKIRDADELLEVITFVQESIEEKIYKGYSIGAMVDLESIKEGDFTSINKMYLKTSRGNYKRRAGKYACINHKGDYSESGKSYKKLLEFIKKNNYKIDGPAYEDCLLDFFGVKDSKDYLTRLAIKLDET